MAEPAVRVGTTDEGTDADRALVRGLGLVEATTIVMGGIIGSGIFRAPSFVAQAVGSPGMSIMVWLVCGLIALFGALCYAELTSALPHTGGTYVYLREAYDAPIITFLYGWVYFLVIQAAGIAAVATVFATYVASIINTVEGATLGVWTQRGIALGCIWLLTVINCIGVRVGGQVSNLFTFLKTSAIVVLIALGFIFAEKGSIAHFTPFWGASTDGGFNPGVFGAAMITALFAYEGWTFSSYVGGEVRNPRRNLPLSILIGISAVMVIYLLVNFVYLYILPFEQLQQSEWVAADTMRVLVGPAGALLISIAVMCSTFGTVNIMLLTSPRIYYAMARDGMLFQGLTRVHPTYRTPANAILVQGLLASAFAVAGGYDEIITYTSFPTYFLLLLVAVGVMLLRKKRPDLPRPYKVWGYPVTPLIFILVLTGYLYTLVSQWKTLQETLIGFAITATGLPFYYHWRKKATAVTRDT
ncbi:MAG: amino acid permease [Candidatus Latescibacteria bacterium]|nr:amino acid permease [Candidatus Latescibacterota bacterium]